MQQRRHSLQLLTTLDSVPVQIVNHGPNDMRMYYHSFDAARQHYVIGLATSRDGFVWDKQGPVFSGSGDADGAHDSRGATSCQVLYNSEISR